MIGAKAEPEVRDAGLIAAAQKVEHYEIAGYGCLATWADQLSMGEVKPCWARPWRKKNRPITFSTRSRNSKSMPSPYRDDTLSFRAAWMARAFETGDTSPVSFCFTADRESRERPSGWLLTKRTESDRLEIHGMASPFRELGNHLRISPRLRSQARTRRPGGCLSALGEEAGRGSFPRLASERM